MDNSQLVPPGHPGYDKLGKVRPVINHCSRVFQDSYNPHCECAVDEAMIPFQGRSTLKQYLPMKPVKRGIKVWVRADSHNGYFSQFDVYRGKGSNTSPELGLGGSVVKQLTRPLVGKYHHVFMDNFFTSPALFDVLLWNDPQQQEGLSTGSEGKETEDQVLYIKYTQIHTCIPHYKQYTHLHCHSLLQGGVCSEAEWSACGRSVDGQQRGSSVVHKCPARWERHSATHAN